MYIIMMGPQGSGKGTQARKLASEYGLVLVEMGAILRKLHGEDSERGRKVKKLMNDGKYVPSEIVHGALEEYLDKIDPSSGMIFDAVPRRKLQVTFLDSYFSRHQMHIDVVIVLKVPEKVTLQRLSGRVISKRTGKIYNLDSNPPGADEKPEDLYQRTDDTREAILSRLREDKKLTQPVIEEYRRRGLVVEIDARGSIDSVYNEIVATLIGRDLI